MSPTALGLCLALAAGTPGTPDTAPAFVPGERFTLAWTHSIERTRWEEDYAVVVDPGTAQGVLLRAVAARIRGSGAGMEPPPDAVLRDGWYHYVPAELEPALLRLSRSGFVPDYELCVGSAACQPLAVWLASDGGATELRACRR
jgi:hypothetical protein